MKVWMVLVSGMLLSSFAIAYQDASLTPKSLQEAIAKNPKGEDAAKLAERIRAYFGKDALLRGPTPKVDELMVAWAIETNAMTPPRVVWDDGKFIGLLGRVGETNVYARVDTLPWGAGHRWTYEVDGKKMGGGNLEVYTVHPDSVEKPDVPKGKLTQVPKWESKIFEGTSRDWWVYVPAQYTPDNPACVMVWQDGAGAKNYVPVVMDNLIAKGDLPIMVNVFISPGVRKDGRPNRSFEYDTLSDQYARFVLEEILPEVEKTVKLRHDAQSLAIAGISSGGICAFTVAWERPNEFSKVLSWVGSFTNIASGPTLRAGGHNYPALIRKTPKKPIRVFLQDGENDLDNVHGNWPLANQQMAKSLAFVGYDYKFEFGHGFHSDRHGRAILPDSLRWLWRDYKP
jgi:enterochelin esterase family protein